MIKFDLKKLAVGAALGLFTITGGGLIANAQSDRTLRETQKVLKQQQKVLKQERKVLQQEAKLDKQRAKLATQQQAEWARRNSQIRANRQTGTDYYMIDTNGSIASGRYRVNRDGRWYNTDQRGAELLRGAVTEGYRQGFMAGRSNMNSSRRVSWTNSNVYRSGNIGYVNGVDRGQYQHYFQQGFQRGYQDGSNRQYMNDRSDRFQYGTYENGQPSILSTILNQVLNIQSY